MSDNKELIRELRSSAFVLDGLSTVVGDNVELDSIERDRISAALHSAGDALAANPPCGTDGAIIADICNAYESGVGHRGRPTADVNPYPPGTTQHEAYRIGAHNPWHRHGLSSTNSAEASTASIHGMRLD